MDIREPEIKREDILFLQDRFSEADMNPLADFYHLGKSKELVDIHKALIGVNLKDEEARSEVMKSLEKKRSRYQAKASIVEGMLANALTPRTMRIGVAVAVMHELGHSCGLRNEEWPGIDNSSTVWIDYQSCMSYYYFGQRLFGYSDGSRGGEFDRNDWEALDVSYFDETAADIEGIGALY